MGGDGLQIISRISLSGFSIRGLYRWEGLGGLGMGCEWLAGLLDCVAILNEIAPTMAVVECLGSCVWNRMEWVQILLYTLTFSLLSFGSPHLR